MRKSARAYKELDNWIFGRSIRGDLNMLRTAVVPEVIAGVVSNSNMKTLALGVLLSLALGAQGFAIIRPPYPAKPMPPYHGRFIVIGDDAKSQAVVKPPK